LAVLIVSLERLIRLVRAGHGREGWSGWTVISTSSTRETESAYQHERFFEHHCPQLLALSELAIRSAQIMAKIRNDKELSD
jgi:hypothetical protein